MTAAASPHVMTTYGRLPIALSHGQGCYVWDTEGRKYLDALGGIAVNTLGHNHPDLVAALQDQVTRLIHTSNYYHVPLQEALAAKLVALSAMDKVFFCSSGLEANEAALKLARKFGHDKGIEKPEIVVYEKAFHGRSIATLSATGNPKVQAGFGPLVEGFIRVPVNNIEALKAATGGNPNVVAVFVEAIQGAIQPRGRLPEAFSIASRTSSRKRFSSASHMPPWRSALVRPWPTNSSPRAFSASTICGA